MMKNYFGPFLLFASLTLLTPRFCEAEEPSPRIAVTGSSEIRVKADTITISGAIVSRSKTIDEAADANDEKISQLSEFVSDMELPTSAVKTQHISLKPIFPVRSSGYGKSNYQSTNQSLFGDVEGEDSLEKLAAIGYEARRHIVIELKDTQRFEEVYKGLLKSGLTELDSVGFSTSKLREYRDEARLMAVRAAKEKATAMAGELGVSIGRVLSIRENENGYRTLSNSNRNSIGDPFGDESASSDVAAGGFEITASIHIEFELKN